MSTALTFRSTQFGAPGITPQSLGIPAAAYPGRIATSSDLIVAVDRQQTRLLLPLNATDTAMTVLDPSMIVAYNLLSIDNEIVKTTGAPAGNVVPIARGFDGTAPALHLASATVSGLVDAYHHNALVAEIEAIESTLGANLSRLPAASILSSTAYDFAPQTPGGTLNVGTNSIPLAPVPDGVNGSNTDHWLYIFNGTGTPEAVKITGGNAVSGAPTGQIFVNCAFAHSGAWAIKSATAGIQEALYVSISSGSNTQRALAWPERDSFVYARITFPTRPWGPSFSISGPGMGVPALIRGASYPSGDIFYFEESGGNQGSLYMGRFKIYNGGVYGTPINTGGAAIHIKGNVSGNIVLEDFNIDNGYKGIDIESAGTVTIRNPYIINSGWFAAGLPSHSAIHIHSTGGKNPSDIHIQGGNFHAGLGPTSANTTQYAILIEASDGIKIEGVNIVQYGNGVVIDPSSGVVVGLVIVSDSILDSFRTHVIHVKPGPGAVSDVYVDNCWLSTRFDLFPAVNSLESVLVDVGATVDRLRITNCVIASSRLEGFAQKGTARDLQFSNNMVLNGNQANAAFIAGAFLGPGTSRYILTGNQIYNVSSAGHQKYGIWIAAGTTDAIVTSNGLKGNETAPISVEGTPLGGFLMAENLGIDEIVGSTPTGATVFFPLNPTFKFTGIAPVTAISPVRPGASGTFITVDGAVTFTAGASIGNTITTVQNRAVSWFSDGTKVYLSS